MLNKLAFSGIYMINFPKGYTEQQIKAKNKKINRFVESNGLEKVVKNRVVSNGQDIVIGINTNFENPALHYEMFKLVSPELAQDYINKTQINLYA